MNLSFNVKQLCMYFYGMDQKWYFVTNIVLIYCEKKNSRPLHQSRISKVFLDHQINFFSQQVRTIFISTFLFFCDLSIFWLFLSPVTSLTLYILQCKQYFFICLSCIKSSASNFHISSYFFVLRREMTICSEKFEQNY